MKWLFVTHKFPWPLNHGTWLRVYHLARSLVELGEQVSVLSYEAAGEGPAEYQRQGITVLDGVRGTLLTKGRGRYRLNPYVYDEAMAESVRRVARDYGVVVLVRPVMLQYSPEAASCDCILADFVDDPILEEQRKLSNEWRPVQLIRRAKFLFCEYIYERIFLKPVSHNLFVSPEDTRYFTYRHCRCAASCVPNGVDAEYFARPETLGESNGQVPTVTFLGNMLHPPNEDAAFYLLRDIAPRIWDALPETRICIVGSNPSKRLLAFSNPKIMVTGLVPDVRPILWKSTVALLPMRTGTGIKNKLLEAWAAGVPVVTTPLACQGVPMEDGKNLLLGRTATELARKTVQLIGDQCVRHTLAVSGRQTVQDCLAWSKAAEKMIRLVTEQNRCTKKRK